MTQGTCAQCGKDYRGYGKEYCSQACDRDARRTAAAARERTPRVVAPKRTQAEIEAGWRAQRGPLRAAYEDGCHDAVLAAIQEHTALDTATGCWIWTRKMNDGYPVVTIGGRHLAVHRVVLEAKMRAELGSQAAHHICATPACVNPEHLQPVTHRENIAEMLARQSYLARIRELEAALSMVEPSHPLLAVIAVA